MFALQERRIIKTTHNFYIEDLVSKLLLTLRNSSSPPAVFPATGTCFVVFIICITVILIKTLQKLCSLEILQSLSLLSICSKQFTDQNISHKRLSAGIMLWDHGSASPVLLNIRDIRLWKILYPYLSQTTPNAGLPTILHCGIFYSVSP